MVTYAFLIFIGFVACYFFIELIRLYRVNKSLAKEVNRNDVFAHLNSEKLDTLCNDYKKTINIETENGYKTNIPSDVYINGVSICREKKINLKSLDSASGTLVGLGLLGTFAGLAFGIKDFDASDTENIQQSIQNLLEGMGTAFYTSLAGMICSLLYTVCDKSVRNKLQRNLHTLTETIDEFYYIDDLSLFAIKQKKLIEDITSKLSYSTDSGENIPISHAVREILSENTEQTKALKSFSTDLALELNNGFDEVLSRQMQQKILPLMENVDTTTKAIVEHIDQMASQVASPATDMIQKVVTDLKDSMKSVIDEFQSGLSGSAKTELENLASQLGSATQLMAEFPQNMASISSTLQDTIEGVKTAVLDISNTSANANSTAMQQMQEQIAYATGAISNAINEVNEVMGNIAQTSQDQNNQMISKMANAAEKMGMFLDSTVSKLSESVQESVKNITDEVSNKQADLIALQEDTTTQTRKLLENFNLGLERLEKMNKYIEETMNMFVQAQGNITGSTASLQVLTGNMKSATEQFSKSQTDYIAKMEDLQRGNQKGLEAISEVLENTENMTADYVEKFEIIKQGLGGIFAQLQNGLQEYSRTVQDSTQKYLDKYSTSLTETTGALANTIQLQNDLVDSLNDTLSKYRK